MPVTTSEFLDDGAELANLFGGVVVAHARVDLAYRCVETILQSLPPQHVVVVVNAPDEVADRSELIALSGQVTVVSPHRPQGYGANLNLGVQSLPAHVKFVVLSNDDIEFSDVWLERIHGHFTATRNVGAVGFALRDSAGGLLLSTGEFPTPLDALVRSVAFPAWVKKLLQQVDGRLQKPRRQARRAAASDNAAQTADWVVGAAMVVRREAFLQVGGFDESFFLYFEETDLCDRLWARGWVVLSAADVPVIHLGGQSTAAERYRKTFREARRHYLVKRLGYVRWALLELLFLPSCLFAGLWLIISIMTRPASARSRLKAFRHSWQRRVFLMS